MLIIKSNEGNTDVMMAGRPTELIAELMSCNKAFYNSLKENNEMMAETFKNFMLENVSMIFEDKTINDEEVDKEQQEKLDKLLDKAQELINKLREQK